MTNEHVKEMFPQLANEVEAEEIIERLATAARAEYAMMVEQTALPATVREWRQLRLYLLIKHVYKGHVPSDSRIAELFGMTDSAAAALVKNTCASYRKQLREVLRSTIGELLHNPAANDSNNPPSSYRIRIGSNALLTEINRILDQSQKNVKRAVRLPDSTYFSISTDAREAVLECVRQRNAVVDE